MISFRQRLWERFFMLQTRARRSMSKELDSSWTSHDSYRSSRKGQSPQAQKSDTAPQSMTSGEIVRRYWFPEGKEMFPMRSDAKSLSDVTVSHLFLQDGFSTETITQLLPLYNTTC